MGINQLIQFLVVAEECRSPEELVDALEKLLAVYRFDYYGLVQQPRPSEDPAGVVLAGRWPENWSDIYAGKKYILIDPTIRYLAVAQRGFRWSETLIAFKDDPHRSRMERMMAHAARFGMQDGYLFPVHSRTGLLGNLTVGGKPVDLSPVEMSLFDAVAKTAIWRMLFLRDGKNPIDVAPRVDTRLTRREFEVLTYLADGMTSNEISRLLDISAHTVDWYMNGLQEKFNAKNRQHAVAIAFRMGLLV